MEVFKRLRRQLNAFSLIFLLGAQTALGGGYDLIDASPSLRILQKTDPLEFSWNLSPKVDTLEIRLYRIEGGKEILLDTANVAGFRTSLRDFGGTLPIGKYRWVLTGFLESQAEPVFSKDTSFSIEPHTPNNAEFIKLGIMLGYSQGEYRGQNQNQELTYQSSRSLYGLFFEIPTFDKKVYFKGGVSAQEYNILGDFQRVSGYYLESQYAFRFFDQRLQVSPGLRLSYYYVPEIQSFVVSDVFTGTDVRSTLRGQTNAFTLGPSVSIAYGITKDWFAQLDLVLEKQIKSEGTTWGLKTPTSDLSYSSDFMLRGLWFWPFELGFRVGYRKLALGQAEGALRSMTTITDVRFAVQLAYLFGSSL